jgi:uncharacterized Tic20 family protein
MSHTDAPQFSSLSSEERSWGMVAHLSALAGIPVPVFGAALGPFIIWRARRSHSAFVEDQGREALNFNITCFLAGLVCFALTWFFIGLLLAGVLSLYWLVMIITAGIKAGEGVAYRYPYCLRLVGRGA